MTIVGEVGDRRILVGTVEEVGRWVGVVDLGNGTEADPEAGLGEYGYLDVTGLARVI